jgi:hypothetical protein
MAENGPPAGPWSSSRGATRSGSASRRDMDARIKATGHDNVYFPMFIPHVTSSRRRPSTSRGSAPSSPSSPTAAGRSWPSRWSCGPPPRRSSATRCPAGSRATATCRCCSTSGPTSCAGSCARAVPAHHRVPVAGGAHRARDLGGGPGRDAAILHDVYDATMRECWRSRRSSGPQDRAREVRRRRGDLHPRGAHARRQGPADGHQPQPRPELRQGLRHQFTDADNGERPAVLDRPRGGCRPARRGADHGPRRRPRPAPAPVGRPRPGRGPRRPEEVVDVCAGI